MFSKIESVSFSLLQTAGWISYIGREEHPRKDIAQVSQIEDVMKILLQIVISIDKKIHGYSYSGGVEDLRTSNVNRNLEGNN